MLDIQEIVTQLIEHSTHVPRKRQSLTKDMIEVFYGLQYMWVISKKGSAEKDYAYALSLCDLEDYLIANACGVPSELRQIDNVTNLGSGTTYNIDVLLTPSIEFTLKESK